MFCTQCGTRIRNAEICRCGAVVSADKQKSPITNSIRGGKLIFGILGVLLFATSAGLVFAKILALSNPATRARTGLSATGIGPIHGIDFLNFSYPSQCWKQYRNSGISKLIRTTNGQWKKGSGSGELYFGVVGNTVIYGDLNSDGRDEAVIHVACGYTTVTTAYEEIFVFGAPTNKPQLWAKFSTMDLSQDFVWRINKVQIVGGDLQISYTEGGSHAQPAWDTIATFRWNGTQFIRTGIARQPFSS